MTHGLYILGHNEFDLIYGPDERRDIETLVELVAPTQTRESVAEDLGQLRNVEVILSGWGGPKLNESFLAAAPALKAVFYGAGSVRGIVTEASWDRGILITSGYGANAVAVAEYAFANVIFALKRAWQHGLDGHDRDAWPQRIPVRGAYGATVAVISLGMTGRRLCEWLKQLDVHVIAYDPFITAEQAAALGVELVSLDDAFCRADVVSLHTPLLDETIGMITEAHLRSMLEGASLINTARGAVIDEPALIRTLTERPDLFALLDVTDPEPPVPESPLYRLPNVVLTPHIAGAMGHECRRMGRYMVEELKRYLAGEPLKWQISREQARILA